MLTSADARSILVSGVAFETPSAQPSKTTTPAEPPSDAPVEGSMKPIDLAIYALSGANQSASSFLARAAEH